MELAQYLHAVCFSPVKSTFEKGIKMNHFTSWTDLNPGIISRHLLTSVATVQGHVHQERQCLQSTKKELVKPSDIKKLDKEYYD